MTETDKGLSSSECEELRDEIRRSRQERKGRAALVKFVFILNIVSAIVISITLMHMGVPAKIAWIAGIFGTVAFCWSGFCIF